MAIVLELKQAPDSNIFKVRSFVFYFKNTFAKPYRNTTLSLFKPHFHFSSYGFIVSTALTGD